MSTLWFSKTPGQLPERNHEDGSTEQLIGVPDKVRAPAPLGGHELQVLARVTGACPKCGFGYCKHLLCTENIGVAECPHCQFVWYRDKHRTIRTDTDE
jgi:hypothetical protein